jgi:hypothetical protein
MFGYAGRCINGLRTVRCVFMFQSMELLNINYQKPFKRGGVRCSSVYYTCMVLAN